MRPSVLYQSRMESMESSMLRMKQAEHCGFSSMPMLNQTGELKQRFWLTRACFSSARNVSASSSDAKYGLPVSTSRHPHSVIWFTTRSINCFTELSRTIPSVGCSGPRKYFDATTFVAFCDHVTGNSISCCSKTGFPSAPEMTAERSSHCSSS